MRNDNRGAIDHRITVDLRILLFALFDPHGRQTKDRLLARDAAQLHATARDIHRHPAPHHERTTAHDAAAQKKPVLAARKLEIVAHRYLRHDDAQFAGQSFTHAGDAPR